MNELLAELGGQERMFIYEYLKDWKPGPAAERAGLPASRGYSYMRQDHMLRALEAEMIDRGERTQMDADWVLMQLGELFTADIADIFKPGTDFLKPIHDWPLVWRRLASGLKVREELDLTTGMYEAEIKEVKIPDRIKVLELLGKHTDIKAFSERIELASDSELTNRLNRGRVRAAEMKKIAHEPVNVTPKKELSFL